MWYFQPFLKTSFTMIVCYVGMLVFAVTFFISVATARHLCRGELAFSVGAGNIANAAMVPTLAVMI